MAGNILKVWNQLAPCKPDGSPGEPLVYRTKIDFSTVGLFEFDLVQEVGAGEIGYIQSAYIDCASCANVFTLLSKTLEQRVTVKGNTQGWYPIMAGDPPIFAASATPGAGLFVNLYLCNVAMPAFSWPTV